MPTKDLVLKNPIILNGAIKETASVNSASSDFTFTPNSQKWSLGVLGDNERKTLSTTPISTNPFGITFKPDGTMMYVLLNGNDRIYQYDLSTPWDIDTAVPRTGTGDELWVGALNNNPQCLHIVPGGGAICVINRSGGAKIDKHEMTTNWDLSTANATAAASQNVGSQDLTPQSYCFGSDGNTMFMIGTENNEVYAYNTVNPYDPIGGGYKGSSYSYTPDYQTNDGTSLNVTPEAIAFSSDGLNMYIAGSAGGRYIYRWTLSIRDNPSSATFHSRVKIPGIGTGQENAMDIYINENDGYVYTAGSFNDKVYQYQAREPIYKENIDLSTGNYFRVSPTLNDIGTEIVFNNPGQSQSFQIELEGTKVPYEVSNISIESNNEGVFGGTPGTGSASMMALGKNGTRIYVAGTADIGSNVAQFNMLVPYDLTTISYAGTYALVLDGDSSANPDALEFSTDGQYMYTAQYSTSNNRAEIYRYELSTPWEVNTANTASEQIFAVGNGSVRGISFKPDGTMMYVTNDVGADIFQQFKFSTPWDLTSNDTTGNGEYLAGTELNVPGTTTTPNFESANITPDGTKFIAINTAGGGNALVLYRLATPWDIRTAYFDTWSNNSLASQPNMEGSAFTEDGTRMFVCEGAGNEIFRSVYIFGQQSIDWPSNLKWKGGYAPQAPEPGEKAIYSFTTKNGGVTYIGQQIASNIS